MDKLAVCALLLLAVVSDVSASKSGLSGLGLSGLSGLSGGYFYAMVPVAVSTYSSLLNPYSMGLYNGLGGVTGYTGFGLSGLGTGLNSYYGSGLGLNGYYGNSLFGGLGGWY